jgi:hypothetical protein
MRWRTTGLIVVVLAGLAAPVSAQGGDLTNEIDFDRPEAWAMQYFASVSLLTAVAPPSPREAGSVELGFELGWIPHLSEDERRVGFNGTKEEDLNKLPVLGRPRVRLGLGRDWTLDLSYLPPIEVAGVKADLLAAALERPLLRRGRFVLGVRASAQIGSVEGDFTCSEEVAAIEPGAPGNEYGCQEPSRDTVDLDYVAVGLTAGYRVGRSLDLLFSAAANSLDMAFQVDALTYGERDRTRLLADGWTWSTTAGVSWPVGERWAVGAELLYTPLEVRRSPGAGVENDPLFNVRAMLSYTLR